MAAKVIISGGGTGGHIFPAIAIANALKHLSPDIEILFVGANGKMEMERVPAAGYPIVGLDIVGINRQSLLKNIGLPYKLIKSLWRARQILRDFKADAAVGVGGFASGPLLMMANRMGLPTLIQEQNSFAGLTNQRLGRKANRICVAYQGMERFFPADRVLLTGNPIRQSSVAIEGKREEAMQSFGLDPLKKTVLVTGGSLGAQTLNESVKIGLNRLHQAGLQVIWQCGSYYYESLKAELGAATENVKLLPFLERMDYAYAAADLVISRAGAGTISELCVIAKPAILVPSPNVADDHQTKNAQALVKENAACMVRDQEAREVLIDQILTVLASPEKQNTLSGNLTRLALPEADLVIAREILALIELGK
ncbi:MAG: undecaprenyldiphospho-muramoylpentapeptide beta-N-acetylglucosaminyltransferase [Sphingobacterium sp.]